MGLLDNQKAQIYYDGNDHGNYQFTSLDHIINYFMSVYVGEDKIISSTNRADVAFHAQRAMQELSFDTFKSCKSQEITVPATLQMILPQDYVNYTKISWVDSAGIKHLMYPTSKTSNPLISPLTNTDGEFTFDAIVDLTDGSEEVVMDGLFYIPYGTQVSGPTINNIIPNSWIVRGFTHVSNTTVLTLKDSQAGSAFTSNTTAKEKLNFYIDNGATLYPNYEDGAKITNVAGWTPGDMTITVTSASDLNDLKVGMIIEPSDNTVWTPETEVVSINDTSILLSKPALISTLDGQTVYFTNPKVLESTTWSNYKSATPSENQDDYIDDTYWPADGERYGLDPQHAQANGSFYIDCISGKIHFSSNVSGKTVILDYISDSLGTNEEMQVHKFAEEAMYKWIMHAILSTRINIPEYQVNRLKKERFAAIRTAKLRLSNIKLEEITQILRGKSKQIKH